VVPEISPAAVAKALAEHFPLLFGAPRALPLKLRIQADIQTRAPGVFTKKSLSIFLHRHTTGTAYLKALVSIPTRHDLDGLPAGEVAEEHRVAATAEVERRRAIMETRRQAERDAQRQAYRDAARAARNTALGAEAAAAAPGDAAPATPQPPRPPRPPRPDRPPRGDRPPQDNRPPQADRPPQGERPAQGERSAQGDRPPRGERPPRADRPTNPSSGHPARADRAERPDRPDRQDRPPRPQPLPAAADAHTGGDNRAALPPTRDVREVREPREPRVPPGPQLGAAELEARRDRAALLRSYEASTLTRANFCVLKRVPEADLEVRLVQARQEREARGPDPRQQPPQQRSEGPQGTPGGPREGERARGPREFGGARDSRDSRDSRGPRRDAPRAPLPAGERTRPAGGGGVAAPAPGKPPQKTGR